MTRGVIYINWPGDERVVAATERSIGSLKQHHPELEVNEHVLAPRGSLLDKAKMLDMSPFDTTLFLDADTVVLGDLEFGFRKAEQFGLACCVCECPYARRYGALQDRGDIIEYNTGVMFFTRGAQDVFDAWKRNVAINSASNFIANDGSVATMPQNDQAAFALAIEETGFNPFILPMNWNYRPIWQHTAFGNVKIWHDYSEVPPGLLQWNKEQTAADAVIQCGRFR